MEEIVSPLDFDINQSIEPVPEVSTVDKLVGLLKGLFWTDKNGAKKRRKIF